VILLTAEELGMLEAELIAKVDLLEAGLKDSISLLMC
jgi:hypothetical protein